MPRVAGPGGPLWVVMVVVGAGTVLIAASFLVDGIFPAPQCGELLCVGGPGLLLLGAGLLAVAVAGVVAVYHWPLRR